MRARAIVAIAATLLGLALAVPASAGASGPRALAGACNGNAYPPSPHAQIEVSTTTPSVGETIEVSGTAYCPDEDVRITLAAAFVTTTHTDGTGAFDPPVKVTKSGKLRLCGIGASGLADDRDCLMLTVRSHGVAGVNAGPGGPGSPGGTAFTGLDLLLIIIVAAVLIGSGALLLRGGRRRRTA